MILQSSTNCTVTVHNLLPANNGCTTVSTCSPFKYIARIVFMQTNYSKWLHCILHKEFSEDRFNYFNVWKSKIMDCDTITNIFCGKALSVYSLALSPSVVVCFFFGT